MEPNPRRFGDNAYLTIADGSDLYLASLIDFGSRQFAGC